MKADYKKAKQNFEALSSSERQALCAIILLQGHAELSHRKKIVDLLKSRTESEYKSFIKRLIGFKFLQENQRLVLNDTLLHKLLSWLPADEMTIVCDSIQSEHAFSLTPDYGVESISTAALRFALHSNRPDYFLHKRDMWTVRKLFRRLKSATSSLSIELAWLQSRKPVIQAYLCIALLSAYYSDQPLTNSSVEKASLHCFKECDLLSLDNEYLLYYGGLIQLSLGNITAVDALCEKLKTRGAAGLHCSLAGSIAFFMERFQEANQYYALALAEMRKTVKKRNYYFDDISGLFYGLCIIRFSTDAEEWMTTYEQYIRYARNMERSIAMHSIYELLSLLSLFLHLGPETTKKAVSEMKFKFGINLNNPWFLLFEQLILFLIDADALTKSLAKIEALAKIAQDHEMMWVFSMCFELLSKAKEPHVSKAKQILEKLQPSFHILNIIPIKQNWEYTLQALETLLLKSDFLGKDRPKSKRLLWLIDMQKEQIQALEQSLQARGGWSKGRVRSWQTLKERNSADLAYLTPEDIKVIDEAVFVSENYWSRDTYDINFPKAIFALIGHPHIVHKENPAIPIVLKATDPELFIDQKDENYFVSLSHPSTEVRLILEVKSVSEYNVVYINQTYAALGQLLGKDGKSLPADAKDKILAVIQHAKHDIKIHSSMSEVGIPEFTGDPTPYMQLLPTSLGIRAMLLVRPLDKPETAYFRAAEGKENIIMLINEIDGDKRIRVNRSFDEEKKQVHNILTQCPVLKNYESAPAEYEMESPEAVLEVLSVLQEYAKTQPLVIEWPKGQSYKIKQRLSTQQVAFKISSQANWFEYDGNLTLDDGAILNLKELLQALDQHSYGRFVRLSDGAFLELTAQFKKQLNLLSSISDGQRINPLSAQVLSDIVSEAENVAFDEGWEKYVQKLKAMRAFKPKLPSTLQANLREYQMEGFNYLSRLSHWGIGACLADDMGLGKTVQTIALLLDQATHGPALVIAPTSVCFNWIEELRRFAPTLKVYDARKDNRSYHIDLAAAFDVVICSYGLLQRNEKFFVLKSWNCIILDEAQAIKNAQTRRWRAIMQLKGKVRVALSGTPIENHLGELWSIFSFINPGLLGSQAFFQNKYATPVQNYSDQNALQGLKTVVQPYILRRLKSDVLKELPEKTEQTIHVEATAEEAAFYEALRQVAEERVAQFMQENNRISVLAEITKLRLACCDSTLVDTAVSLPNSKLKAFIEIITNIVGNGHKALVFSQYVSFLNIIKQTVTAENIRYQYLDGSTPAAQRKKSVEAFQNGEGDIFLLSLKAGGSGLNLTAADYVLHLDPWWNPAVEDQASDRAHRIGQQRPVTVYRFVMQNTIEEKIVALHQKKRDLADNLLSGQGGVGKLSNEDLLDLIGMPAVV